MSSGRRGADFEMLLKRKIHRQLRSKVDDVDAAMKPSRNL